MFQAKNANTGFIMDSLSFQSVYNCLTTWGKAHREVNAPKTESTKLIPSGTLYWNRYFDDFRLRYLLLQSHLCTIFMVGVIKCTLNVTGLIFSTQLRTGSCCLTTQGFEMLFLFYFDFYHCCGEIDTNLVRKKNNSNHRLFHGKSPLIYSVKLLERVVPNKLRAESNFKRGNICATRFGIGIFFTPVVNYIQLNDHFQREKS